MQNLGLQVMIIFIIDESANYFFWSFDLFKSINCLSTKPQKTDVKIS